jgi:hypothetical protein
MDSTNARDEMSALLAQGTDELSALLAQSDPDAEETLYAFEAARAKGEAILQRLTAPLRARICDEWEYCTRRKMPNFSDRVALAVALADVILGAAGKFPPSVIAALLVKQGLDAFCRCNRA